MSDEKLVRADAEQTFYVRQDAEFLCEMLAGFSVQHRMEVFIFLATNLFLNVKPMAPLTRLDAYDKYAAAIRENIRLNIEQEAKRGNKEQSR